MLRLKLILITLLTSQVNICQQTIDGSIFHDGIQRQYKLYIPASYNSNNSVPLVFSFHGLTSNANLNFFYTKFHEIADTAGFILVHPQGTLNAIGVPHWNVGVLGSTNSDDIGFTDALIDSVMTNYNIDENRIYTCGMSNGGFLSFLLGCQLSHRFAAIASVTGSMTFTTYNQCNPVHPTPVLQIHGTLDPTVPYNGSSLSMKPINDVLAYWVNENNCNPNPIVTPVPNINLMDGSIAEHINYHSGDNGSAVEHYKIIGGAHDWPGAWGNQDVDASVEIWRFFYRYNLQNLISYSTARPINEFLKVFPTASYGEIYVNYNANSRYSIYNLNGVLIKWGEIYSGENKINLKTINKGLYFIQIDNVNKRFIIL